MGSGSKAQVYDLYSALLARKAETEASRQRRDEPRRCLGLPAIVLCRVLRHERTADERAACVAERLGREELARRLDDRQPRSLVAAIEGEPREDLAAEVRRADTVPGEAEAVVDAAAAPEDR